MTKRRQETEGANDDGDPHIPVSVCAQEPLSVAGNAAMTEEAKRALPPSAYTAASPCPVPCC